MCNRLIQRGQDGMIKEVRPGRSVSILLPGASGEYDIQFWDVGVFGGCARLERLDYWIVTHGGLQILAPITAFGQTNKATGKQTYAPVPPNSAAAMLFFFPPPCKGSALIKVITRPATALEFMRSGCDRTPVIYSSLHPWLSVTDDQLPADNGKVWCTNGHLVCRGRYTPEATGPDSPEKSGWFDDDNGEPIKVSHWLPFDKSPHLPPLPPIPRPKLPGGNAGI